MQFVSHPCNIARLLSVWCFTLLKCTILTDCFGKWILQLNKTGLSCPIYTLFRLKEKRSPVSDLSGKAYLSNAFFGLNLKQNVFCFENMLVYLQRNEHLGFFL